MRRVAAYLIITGALAVGAQQYEQHQTVELQKYTERQDAAIQRYQLLACHRGVKDRRARVRTERNLVSYYDGVLAAESVKGDVKRSARRIRRSLLHEIRELEVRAGLRLDEHGTLFSCEVAVRGGT
jgi:hypothetical protein